VVAAVVALFAVGLGAVAVPPAAAADEVLDTAEELLPVLALDEELAGEAPALGSEICEACAAAALPPPSTR